jgi:hypothetical protein
MVGLTFQEYFAKLPLANTAINLPVAFGKNEKGQISPDKQNKLEPLFFWHGFEYLKWCSGKKSMLILRY